MRTLGYWLVVLMLALATVVCLGFTAAKGTTASGLLGLLGTLVFAALLFSYARTSRVARTPPMP